MAALITLFWLCLLSLPADANERTSLELTAVPDVLKTRAYCERPNGERPCGILPHDVTGFSASRVYTLIERSAQDPFDLFSWRTFVALNWPVASDPFDEGALAGSAAERPRTWQTYVRPEDLSSPQKHGACDRSSTDPSRMQLSNWLQAGGFPLIDRKGNYVLYDVRINPAMERYILNNGLDSPQGQARFHSLGGQVSFPMGFYDNNETRMGGEVGSLAIKSAWRILPEGVSGGGMLLRNAQVNIPSRYHLSGEPECLDLRVGLVGMHIVRRTRSANGDHWIWATFEHIENAPESRDARGPNNVFGGPFFPQGCRGDRPTEETFTFYDGKCPNCPTNLPPPGDQSTWRWSSTPPHARFIDGTPIPPAQVTRCWRVAMSTDEINASWRKRLEGTGLENYALSTTQWKGADLKAVFPAGEVPRFMTNSTMETYIQSESSGSCLGCHAGASTTDGHTANFNFVLGRVSQQGWSGHPR